MSCPSFFSQIATAILFKKNNRTSSKISYKIYDEKIQNSFLNDFLFNVIPVSIVVIPTERSEWRDLPIE